MDRLERSRTWGLKFARDLNFTDAQYEEALKRIDSPDNANQLLVALIDVSSCASVVTNQTTTTTTVNSNDHDEVRQSNAVSGFNQVQAEQQVGRQSPASVTSPVFGNDPDNYTSRATTWTSPLATSSYMDHLLDQQNRHGDSSSSLSTSCYSSITASDQSLESFSQQQQQSHNHQQPQLHRSIQSVGSQPRKIYIDGSNVAREHGKNVTFSWMGIKLCVDWFLSRSHKVVKVFVPVDRCSSPQLGLQERAIIEQLSQVDALIKTPAGCNDDLFIIEAARQNNGVIVSNDQFRDEKRFNDDLVNYINSNRLPFVFVDDLFIPAADPLGRAAPRTKLEDFLRESLTNETMPNICASHSKLCRAKSHQRYYQRNGYYSSKQTNNQPQHVGVTLHKSLQATKSLPVEQLRSSSGANDNNQQQISAGKGAYHHHNHHHHHHHQPQFRHYNQHQQAPSRYNNQIRKSISIAYGNEMKSTPTTGPKEQDDIQPMLAGGQLRSALCRTKSHNI